MTPGELLKAYFGYDNFRPMQSKIIDQVLAGRDCLVLMPTGGGKSLCYQLPALMLPGLTLVVSPLIALMKDQVDGLVANGVAAGFINSSLSTAEIGQLLERAEKSELKLLYIAPERLASVGFRDWLSQQNVSLIAVDEAHCISEWGHDFRPDYRNLARLRCDFADVPVMALTATATTRVVEDISTQLGLGEGSLYQSGFDRSNLSYIVEPKRNSLVRLEDVLRARNGQAAIIYCFSRRDTETLTKALNSKGFSALAYHAGLSAEARATAQDKFIRDEVSIMVATIAFGMGIDKPDIRLVVHYDLPKTIEGYYQEIGRAGRDGLASDCILFYSYGDSMKHGFFINQLVDDNERQKARQKLSQVVNYCESESCRRQFLLKYFGESVVSESCLACDNCLQPSGKFDATEIAKKILSAVYKTGERFGASYVADVLRGSKSVKVLERCHDNLSVFGIGKDYSAADLKQLMRWLVNRGLLAQRGDEYTTLEMTLEGRKFLVSQQTIKFPKLTNKLAKVRAAKTSDLDYDRELFEKLRSLRRRLAEEQGVAPFIICGDRTLVELAFYLPQNGQSLSKIFGLGEQKLTRYGKDLISEIVEHCREKGLEEKANGTNIAPVLAVEPRAGATMFETLNLINQGLSLPTVAKQRGLTLGTIIGHVETLLATGEVVNIDKHKPKPEELGEIRAAAERVGGLNLLAPIKAVVGERFSYDELRLARLVLKIEDSRVAAVD